MNLTLSPQGWPIQRDEAGAMLFRGHMSRGPEDKLEIVAKVMMLSLFGHTLHLGIFGRLSTHLRPPVQLVLTPAAISIDQVTCRFWTGTSQDAKQIIAAITEIQAIDAQRQADVQRAILGYLRSHCRSMIEKGVATYVKAAIAESSQAKPQPKPASPLCFRKHPIFDNAREIPLPGIEEAIEEAFIRGGKGGAK